MKNRLADYVESRAALTQRIMLAFTCPAIVTVVATLVIVALLTYVVPQVVGVFTQTRQQLPLLTVVLIATSDFVRGWGLWMLAAIVGAVVAFRLALRSPTFRLSWDARMLATPIAGRLILSLIHISEPTRPY